MTQKKLPKAKGDHVPRVPQAKRSRGIPSTMTPQRMGGIVVALLSGDTVKAACSSAAVVKPTYDTWRQRGEKAINDARILLDEDDIEGAIWAWLDANGGPQNGSPKADYWTADPPEWWPSDLHKRWSNALFVMLVYWARGQSERVYRQVVTTAAKDGDWKAAEFMLTHSFGWRKEDRLELTGDGGGAIQVDVTEDRALSALAALADRRKTIDDDTYVDAETIEDTDHDADS